MRARRLIFLLAALVLMTRAPARAEFTFADTAYQGVFTTENLDAILDAYDLIDGWYWTTAADTPQTYRGQYASPGWTDTSVRIMGGQRYKSDVYGCRWNLEKVSALSPDRGGYGECYGFAQFIGYLLSGEINPQQKWKKYYTLEDAGGLKVGDIIRSEYTEDGVVRQHSAVVYSIRGEEVLFLYVSGGEYNRIRVGAGFTMGKIRDVRFLEDIGHLPWLKISRCPLNK